VSLKGTPTFQLGVKAPDRVFFRTSAPAIGEPMNLASIFQNSRYAEDYPAGTTIFAQGQPSDVMYVVLAGELEIQRGGRAFETLTAGAIVGEMAMIDKAPRSATVIAKTNCRLVPVDEKRFEFMVAQTPFFAVDVMRVIVDRLRRTTERAMGPQSVEGNRV
jgi:CRP-like cAMP-binding protein